MIRPTVIVRALACLVPVVTVLAGCSRETSVVCSRQTQYLEAEDAGPLRIPDGLSVPDEIEALRIPSGAIGENPDDEAELAADGEPSPTCLELSPAFSRESDA